MGKRSICRVGVPFLVAGSAILVFSESPAAAQTVAAQPEAPKPADTIRPDELDDIVVTAQKRSERLNDVPIAISAFTSNELAARSVVDTNDIGKFTPNVNFLGAADSAGSGNIASLYIRGIGQSDFLPTADPAVGVYIDDVYLGRSVGGVLDLLDTERVEVLRGPQGTLFGRNTIGGALSVITKRPEFKNSGSIQGTVGNQDTYQVTGIGNLALSDSAAFRLAVDYDNRGGYARSTSTPSLRLGGTETFQARGQLLLKPSSALTVRLIGDYYRDSNDSIPSVAISDRRGGATLFYDGLVAAGLLSGPKFTDPGVLGSLSDPFVSSRTGPSSSKDEIWGVAGIVEYEFSPAVTLKSISSYRNVYNRFLDDGDGAAPRLAEYDSRFDQWQVSQEFQLSGKVDRLKWVLGAYYFHEDASNLWDILLYPGLYTKLGTLPGPVFPLSAAACPTLCAGGPGNPLNAALDNTERDFSSIRNDNFAGFAQGTFNITPELALTAGGRYTVETKTFARSEVRPESGTVVVPLTGTQRTFRNFSPKVGLDYKIGGTLIYASYTEGYRSGTFNGRANTAAGVNVAVAPEGVKSYEAGVKASMLDHRLQVNVAAFHADYSNIQVLGNRASGASFEAFLTNAARARINGVEVEATLRPVSQLDLNAGFGYTDAKITQIDPTISALTSIVAGNVLRKTPKANFSLGAQWTQPVPIGSLALRVDYSHKSSQFHSAENYIETFEGAYGLLDARLSFSSEDKSWYVALYGRNLTDTTYYKTKFIAGGTLGLAYPQRPREFGLTVRRSF